MKKAFSAVLALVLAASMLAACGTEKPASVSAGAASTETPAEKVTITFGYWGDSGETEAYTKAIEGVEKAVPGVNVELQHYPGTADFWSSLPGQIAAGTAPDIIAPTNEGHLSYISEGLFLPLSEYNLDMSTFNPNAVDAWNYEGKQYGIPASAAPGIFVINKDLWDAAGLKEYPTTWDEVYKAAKVLTKGDVKGLCIDFSQGYHPTQYMNSFGGGWKNGKEINSEANMQALDYIFKMYNEGYAINPKDIGLSWDGEVFAAGKCAMTTAGTWYIGMMKEAAPDTNYEIIPMPGANDKNGCTLHSIAFTVLNNSKNPDIAAKVAYYMAREEAQKVSAEIVGTMPSNTNLTEWYFTKNEKMASAKASLAWATSFGYPVQASEFQQDLVRAFEEVEYAGGKQTSKEILDTLAEKYSK
ncbi:MAG: sugar ABC transporter substrate-binding protein [Ruthenibacterium sp.]